jgi:formate C-acetyltransferase
MEEVYEDTAGYQQIIRRAKFMATLLERKKLYIDENLFVGSMASTVNGIYTYPEWNIDWMKEEKTVEKSKTPEDRKANEWALNYWEKRSLKPRTLEIFEKRYGFDPRPTYDSGFVISFFDWPGGGGNLNYPRVYNNGLASMIKDVQERQMSLEMRLPNASKLYFYEASLILMRSIIRLSHRYAELAREMAAKEKNKTRKAELIAIAETCEWVPEHPARNLREAMQCHFLCHVLAEIEQVGCGYSEAYLGQNFEPFYQRDKAAGLVNSEQATFMLENLFIKLNEIGYYYGEKVALQNSADLGQSISLGGYTEDGEDATAEMDYLILDASGYLHLPQPPLSCIYTERMSGKFLEKVLDVIGTGVGMPQFVNGDVMMKRGLYMFGDSEKGITLEKARRNAIGACVGSYIPSKQVTRWKGNPTSGK